MLSNTPRVSRPNRSRSLARRVSHYCASSWRGPGWRFLAPLAATLAMVLVLSTQAFAAAREASAVYRVQPGDTLGAIAAAARMSVEQLAAANRLANPNYIVAGQVLQIPGRDQLSGVQGAAARDAHYVVKAGDTLSKIARDAGVPVATLMDVNQLADPHRLTVDQRLRLPSGTAAGARTPVRVVVDAGHHEREVGAAHTFPDGVVLREDALNLRVALRLKDLLQEAGYQVTLTRSSAARVNVDNRDLNDDGTVSLVDDLQARVDVANRVGADLFVSVHFNGHDDPSDRGTYTFWNPNRPFADQSGALAERVQEGLVRALKQAGYDTVDHGARTDASVLGDEAYFLLGPKSQVMARPSQMPGIIGEALFLTNPHDANALRNDRVVDAVARGYFDGIHAYTAALRAPAAESSALAVGAERFWTVLAGTYRETPVGERLSAQAADELARRGLPVEVLVSRKHEALLPGFLVVSSGHFPSREAATAHLSKIRATGYSDAYVREIR